MDSAYQKRNGVTDTSTATITRMNLIATLVHWNSDISDVAMKQSPPDALTRAKGAMDPSTAGTDQTNMPAFFPTK
jgi:hypothetical protein